MPGKAFPRIRKEYGSYQWYQSQLGRMEPDVGGDPNTWEHAAIEFFHDIINRGVQRVYYLDDMGDGILHRWSFLRSRFDIQTTKGKQDYQLPADCGGVVGCLSYSTSDSGYSQVKKTSVDQILKWRSINTDVSGYPEWFAEEFQDNGGHAHQGRILMTWPSADSSYTLNGTMDISPLDIDGETRVFAYGGRPMVETYLASMMGLMNPQYEGYYQQRLRASMQADLNRNQPEFLGKNSNEMGDTTGRFIEFDPVTYTSGS